MNYPSNWPLPNPLFPHALVSRITEDEKEALYARTLTTKDLAKRYGLHPHWVSTLFPGKVGLESKAKRQLIQARRDFRREMARRVVVGLLTTKQAADTVRTTYRTMARAVADARDLTTPKNPPNIPPKNPTKIASKNPLNLTP